MTHMSAIGRIDILAKIEQRSSPPLGRAAHFSVKSPQSPLQKRNLMPCSRSLDFGGTHLHQAHSRYPCILEHVSGRSSPQSPGHCGSWLVKRQLAPTYCPRPPLYAPIVFTDGHGKVKASDTGGVSSQLWTWSD